MDQRAARMTELRRGVKGGSARGEVKNMRERVKYLTLLKFFFSVKVVENSSVLVI